MPGKRVVVSEYYKNKYKTNVLDVPPDKPKSKKSKIKLGRWVFIFFILMRNKAGKKETNSDMYNSSCAWD